MFRAYEGEEVQSASVNTRFKIRFILSRSHKKMPAHSRVKDSEILDKYEIYDKYEI